MKIELISNKFFMKHVKEDRINHNQTYFLRSSFNEYINRENGVINNIYSSTTYINHEILRWKPSIVRGNLPRVRDPPPTNWSVLVNKSSRITISRYPPIETVENLVKLAESMANERQKPRCFSKFNSIKVKLAYLRTDDKFA